MNTREKYGNVRILVREIKLYIIAAVSFQTATQADGRVRSQAQEHQRAHF